MSPDLLCASWPLQLYEPATPDSVSRVRVQEEYLGQHLGPWLRGHANQLGALHSYHFMRYLDATHLGHVVGIIIEFRILGLPDVVSDVAPSIDQELAKQKAANTIAEFYRKPDGLWRTSLIPAYGGPAVAEPFAQFLAASSKLTLELLSAPAMPFVSRHMVLEEWGHCFRLVTSCTG